MMKVLVLDFDGVIFDSAREAFRVALDTYTEMTSGSRLPALEKEGLYARFLEIMPLGNRAEDYAVALLALEAERELADQAAYDDFKAKQAAPWLRDFHKRFYRIRHTFAADDPEAWRALLRPYAAFVDVLRRRAGQATFAIATAKDRASVRKLLRSYGIDDLFAGDLVLDKETGVSKAAHLAHLHDRLGADYGEMTFVDDKVNHLDSVAPLGVRCVLAAWGYNGEREHHLARARGYRVCGLDDVEASLFV